MIEVILLIAFIALGVFVAWDSRKNDDGPSDWKSDM